MKQQQTTTLNSSNNIKRYAESLSFPLLFLNTVAASSWWYIHAAALPKHNLLSFLLQSLVVTIRIMLTLLM